MEIRLFDAAEDKMLMDKAYKGPLDEKDLMIYKFTDAVINELTGTPGLATTQIAFVTQPAEKREREIFITDILGRKLRQINRHRNLLVSPRFSPETVFIWPIPLITAATRTSTSPTYDRAKPPVPFPAGKG